MRAVLAAVLALAATPTLAVPMCYAPKSGNVVVFEVEIGKMGETERASFYEKQLQMRGIDAMQTTFWNGCIQTNVRENGRISMRFYDPWTLEEIAVD